MTIPVDEEVETRHVKFLQQLPPGMTFLQAVQRFNSNIPYSGLIHAVTQVSCTANLQTIIEKLLSAVLMTCHPSLPIPSSDYPSMSELTHYPPLFQESFFAENKEKLINGAISALLTHEGDQSAIGLHDLEEQFLALRRLVASKAGFNAFTQLPK